MKTIKQLKKQQRIGIVPNRPVQPISNADAAAAKKFVKDEALACELAGHFYLEMDEKVTALDYLVKAHERYEMWGATGKATKLHEEMMTKLS